MQQSQAEHICCSGLIQGVVGGGGREDIWCRAATRMLVTKMWCPMPCNRSKYGQTWKYVLENYLRDKGKIGTGTLEARNLRYHGHHLLSKISSGPHTYMYDRRLIYINVTWTNRRILARLFLHKLWSMLSSKSLYVGPILH